MTVRANSLDAYCLRCWPELRDGHKITPCTALALLAEEGVPSTCEVDLPALIGTFELCRLADAPVFDFDITAYLEDEGAIQLAHCGAAAPQLATEGVRPALRAHMRTGTGATVEFPFKTGPATVAKLMRPAAEKLKLFVAEGEVVSSEGIRGSVAIFRPRVPLAAFMDKWIREAVEHHISLAYGCLQRDLELFCEFTGVECLPV